MSCCLVAEDGLYLKPPLLPLAACVALVPLAAACSGLLLLDLSASPFYILGKPVRQPCPAVLPVQLFLLLFRKDLVLLSVESCGQHH